MSVDGVFCCSDVKTVRAALTLLRADLHPEPPNIGVGKIVANAQRRFGLLHDLLCR